MNPKDVLITFDCPHCENECKTHLVAFLGYDHKRLIENWRVVCPICVRSMIVECDMPRPKTKTEYINRKYKFPPINLNQYGSRYNCRHCPRPHYVLGQVSKEKCRVIYARGKSILTRPRQKQKSTNLTKGAFSMFLPCSLTGLFDYNTKLPYRELACGSLRQTQQIRTKLLQPKYLRFVIFRLVLNVKPSRRLYHLHYTMDLFFSSLIASIGSVQKTTYLYN